MADKFVSMRNLEFLLYEVFDTESLTRYPYFSEHGREIFDMVLDTGLKMGKDLLFPYFKEMDEKQPVFENGELRVHPMVKTMMRECGEGGWISAHAPCETGGQQIPISIMTAFDFIFCAANYSASVFVSLTKGAAHLVESFGSPEQIETYVPKMYSGQWQGTMALTEPQAGSSLTDITTRAAPTGHDHYEIRGQKIFISVADHDCVDNVVNLLLAKIDGAPPGIKGISLFIVPQKRLDEHGGLVDNGITTTAIYHKLGYRGAPITQLSLGEDDVCRGWLVGEPHRGLKYMFQMMNEARIEVGLGAAAIATAAYYAALEYANERPQGRKITSRDLSQPQVPIIEHADVKRMLLFQRSVVEGSLCLVLQCAKYVDLVRVLDGEEQEKYALLLDLLTPVAKTYPSEMAVLSVSTGLQCLGGYGYCDEFPLEQYYRDVRIHPIHEGTTAIQGMDLLGRKVVMKNGKAVMLYMEQVQQTIAEARQLEELAPYAETLSAALDKLQQVTMQVTGLAMQGEIEKFLADATLFLEFFGIIAVSWQWLIQAVTATDGLAKAKSEDEIGFYTGKLFAFKYFFEYELPKIEGLAVRLNKCDGLTVEMKPEFFAD